MAEQSYTGGCHCGAVRFEVVADLDKTFVCNCSICSKKGFIWTFTGAEKFTLAAGEAKLSTYEFYKRAIHHRFCTVCGVEPFASGEHNGEAIAAIDVRCLDGVDNSMLQSAPIDGKSV